MDNKIYFLRSLCFDLHFLGIGFLVIPFLNFRFNFVKNSPAHALSVCLGIIILLFANRVYSRIKKLKKMRCEIISIWYHNSDEFLKVQYLNYKLSNAFFFILCMVLSIGIIAVDIKSGLILLLFSLVIISQQNVMIKEYFKILSKEDITLLFTENGIIICEEIYTHSYRTYAFERIEINNNNFIIVYVSLYNYYNTKEIYIRIPEDKMEKAIYLQNFYNTKFTKRPH
ncbi:MAG: hypothetical protein ATN31_08855 [Candidatus Epulonipiscioides saccharophilum]|nr:MAG: hypothetical protein ATN31_08855 [Epulopiscium sp. AS2M-Bin001]